MGKLRVEQVEGGVLFFCKAVPGSSRTAIAGLLEDMLKVKVAAAPEHGKANKCLTEYLAQELGVKKTHVDIISGTTSAVKQIRVSGISAKEVLEKFC